MMSSMMSTDVFYEMPREENLYKNQYDVKAGRWPESYDECVVVMTADGSISDFLLYTLGLRDAMELDDMIEQFMKDEDVDTPDNIGTYRYEDILGTTFKLVNASDYYSYDSEYKVWKDKSDNNKYMKKLVKNGEDLKVVGIVQPSEDANGALLRTGIYYPAELTDHVIEEAKNSKIVKAQMKNEDIDVFTNEEFGKESDNDFDMGSLFKIDEGTNAENIIRYFSERKTAKVVVVITNKAQVVNPFGTQALAGYSATMRVENVFSLIFVSIGNAVSPYVSQNFGAKKMERIKKGPRRKRGNTFPDGFPA